MRGKFKTRMGKTIRNCFFASFFIILEKTGDFKRTHNFEVVFVLLVGLKKLFKQSRLYGYSHRWIFDTQTRQGKSYITSHNISSFLRCEPEGRSVAKLVLCDR